MLATGPGACGRGETPAAGRRGEVQDKAEPEEVQVLVQLPQKAQQLDDLPEMRNAGG